MTKPSDNQTHAAHGLAHAMPLWLLLAVWGGLLVLTVLTVAAAHHDFGRLNLWIALLIATIKASLVALFFMHLWYDKPFYAIVFIGALVFVMLFVGLALLDTTAYQPEMIPGPAPAVKQ